MINLGFIWALFLHFIQQEFSLTYEPVPTSRPVSVFAVWLPWLGLLHSPPPRALNFECWLHVSTFSAKWPLCYLLFCLVLYSKFVKCPFLYESFFLWDNPLAHIHIFYTDYIYVNRNYKLIIRNIFANILSFSTLRHVRTCDVIWRWNGTKPSDSPRWCPCKVCITLHLLNNT
jgi:hypothetical protein